MNVKEIEKSICQAKSIEDKVALSVLYAQVVTGGKDKIYDAINMEKHLFKDCSYLVADFKSSGNESDKILHVISEGYLTGGHTRLCERLSVIGDQPSDIMITRKIHESVALRLQSYFELIHLTYCDDLKSNILKQIGVLAKYKKIVLHIHPDDIILVLSLGLLKSIKNTIQVFFVNHADHLFSYGKSLPDVMFQISNRGYLVDSMIVNSDYKNSFLGLPISNSSKPIFDKKRNTFLMVGASYKMKPNGEFSAPEVVDFLLTFNPGSIFKIVGANMSDYWWWLLKLKFRSRLIIYNELDYNEYINVVRDSDVCVDTLPVTGGTAFVEMYMLGLKPMGINTGISGYTPLDIIKVDSVKEIIHGENAASSYDLSAEVRNVHSIKTVKGRYIDALNGCYHNVPHSLKVSSNNMELFVRKNKQNLSGLTIKNILSIKSLTCYQKLWLLFDNYKCSQFFTIIPLKFILLYYKKITTYFVKS